MLEVISNLKNAGGTPLACCCGHGRYKRTIIFRTTDGRAVEYYSGQTIPRKKRFYVRDKDQVFFVPEVEQFYSSLEEIEI
jgi:hypothetical protein